METIGQKNKERLAQIQEELRQAREREAERDKKLQEALHELREIDSDDAADPIFQQENPIDPINDLPTSPEVVKSEMSLKLARMKYTEAYKKFMAERKAGLGKFTRAKEYLLGADIEGKKKKRKKKKGDLAMEIDLDTEKEEASKIPAELKALEKEYDLAANKLGHEMYEAKKIDLESSGMTEEEQKAELERYTQNDIFTRTVVQEDAILEALKVENLPPKEKGIFRRAFNWYIKRGKPVKVAISLALSTAVIGSFSYFTGYNVGDIANSGYAAFVAGRAVRTTVGVTVGHAAGKLYDIIFKDKSEEIKEQKKEQLSKIFSEEMNAGTARKGYAQIQAAERKTKRGRMWTKAIINILAGGATSLTMSYGAGAIGGVRTGAIPSDAPKTPTPTPTPTPSPSLSPTPTPSPSPSLSPSPTPDGTIDGASKPPTTPPSTEVKVLETAIVGKGKGIEHAFIKQIEGNPELAKQLGYEGDINDAKALHKFAGAEAHRVALKTGYVDQAGNEVRVAKANTTAYELNIEDGKPVVTEKNLDGTVIETRHEGDKFGEVNENEYKAKTETTTKPKVVEDTSEPKSQRPRAGKPKVDDVTETKTKSADISASEKTTVGDITKIDTAKGVTGTTILKPNVTDTLVDSSAKKAEEAATNVKTPEEIKEEILNKIENADKSKADVAVDDKATDTKINKTETLGPDNLADKHPELTGTPFEKNNYNLPKDKLVEVNKVYQKLYTGRDAEIWKNIKGAHASELVGSQPDGGDNDGAVRFFNKVYELSGIKPRKGDLIDRAETVDEYMARAIAKVSELDLLDKLKY